MRISLRTLFNPAIHRLNRLSYPYKLGLVGVGAVVAIAFFVISLHITMRSAISDTQDERLGVQAYPPVAQVILLTQQHMTLATTASAAPELKAVLQSKAAETDTAIAAVTTLLDGNAHALGLGKSWKNVVGEWQQIKTKAPALPANQILGAYQKLNAALETFLGDLGEASSLIREPDHHLNIMADLLFRKLPNASFQTGRLNVLSIIPLETKDMAEDWVKVAPQFAKTTATRNALLNAFQRAGNDLPTLQNASQNGSRAIAESGTKFDQMVDQEVVKGGFGMEAPAFTIEANQALAALHGPVVQAVPAAMLPLLDSRLAELQTRFWRYSLGAALIVVILAYFSVALFLSILHSVNALSNGAQQIAKGNLNVQVELPGRDELSQVATQFNAMINSFGSIIRGVRQTADGLLASSTTLAQTSSSITNGSVQQSDASATMAASIQQMTVGVDEISKHAATAEDSARLSGNQSSSGCEVVQRASAEMENIALAVREAADVIGKLGHSTAQIHSIVVSIKEIADQTNMLALNASIEAARAGEDGQGFAVVADQVRSLAERTTEATQEISSMVDAIQRGTNRAVAAMQTGVAGVHQGVTLIHQVGTAMESIHGESGKVVGVVSEISHALREQSTANTNIAQSIEEIARMADENREEVMVLGNAANRLESLSVQLANAVRRFQV